MYSSLADQLFLLSSLCVVLARLVVVERFLLLCRENFERCDAMAVFRRRNRSTRLRCMCKLTSRKLHRLEGDGPEIQKSRRLVSSGTNTAHACTHCTALFRLRSRCGMERSDIEPKPTARRSRSVSNCSCGDPSVSRSSFHPRGTLHCVSTAHPTF